VEEEKLTPSEVASLLKRDKATITRMCKSLEDKGYIFKEEIDNKSFFIVLSESGREVLKEATQIAKEFHDEMVNLVGERNFFLMIENLNKIRDYFEGQK
jgi:DNA-binding MarR family transcriptional regulator